MTDEQHHDIIMSTLVGAAYVGLSVQGELPTSDKAWEIAIELAVEGARRTELEYE